MRSSDNAANAGLAQIYPVGLISYMSTVPHSAGQSRIFIRCPAKCDRCPAFLENGIIIFSVADYATFLPRNATK